MGKCIKNEQNFWLELRRLPIELDWTLKLTENRPKIKQKLTEIARNFSFKNTWKPSEIGYKIIKKRNKRNYWLTFWCTLVILLGLAPLVSLDSIRRENPLATYYIRRKCIILCYWRSFSQVCQDLAMKESQ